jgi:hypothetical protein
VTFRTPVLLGNRELPPSIAAIKMTYKTGDSLNSGTVPSGVASLPFISHVLDLPLENAGFYLKTQHNWLSLHSDDWILGALENIVLDAKSCVQNNMKRAENTSLV